MIDMKIDYSKFAQNLQGAVSRVGFGATDTVNSIAQEIMEKSKEQVPIDTSALQSTAFVEVDSSTLTATASFGYSGEGINPKTGETVADYMIAVHERLDVNHPVGKAKFLEDPVNDFAQNAERTIGDKISGLLASWFVR